MGYDGGFTKIRMKINTQEELNEYELKLRSPIYEIIGMDNFYKFENIAINLDYLDNSWVQAHVMFETMSDEKFKNYKIDDTHFTLITKDILGQYISNLHGQNNNKVYFKDIKSLENLYNSFDWDNDTLVFSYSY